MRYDDGTSLGKALTPARLRAMAAWFREFAALASADQRPWQLDLAGYYDRLADEREARLPIGGEAVASLTRR